MSETLLQVAGYLCSSQFCLRVAVPEGESDRYCKTESHISKNVCLHSSLVLTPGVEPKRLNF